MSGVGHLSGWQWLFLLEGLPSALLGAATLIYLTDRPEDARWLTLSQRAWLSGRLEHEAGQTAETHGSPLRALVNPLVWALTIPYFAQFTLNVAYLAWAPILIRDALHTSNVVTGLLISGIALYAASLYPMSATLSDRWDERCGFPALGLAFGATGCVAVALLAHSPLRIAGFVLIATCQPFILPSFWCLPTKFLKGAPAAAGIALIISVATSGGILGPNLVGLLKQATGSDVGAFFALGSLALTGSLVCLGLRQMTVLGPGRAPVDLVPEAQPT
jgi:sugar phosphate permease